MYNYTKEIKMKAEEERGLRGGEEGDREGGREGDREGDREGGKGFGEPCSCSRRGVRAVDHTMTSMNPHA